MSVINIGSRAVGEGHPCYVIAEAGVNHNAMTRSTKPWTSESE